MNWGGFGGLNPFSGGTWTLRVCGFPMDFSSRSSRSWDLRGDWHQELGTWLASLLVAAGEGGFHTAKNRNCEKNQKAPRDERRAFCYGDVLSCEEISVKNRSSIENSIFPGCESLEVLDHA